MAELVGAQGVNRSSHPGPRNYDPAVQQLAVFKSNIDGGKGIGAPLILAIMKRRRVLAGENVDSTDADMRGMQAIREAVAALKASGEHDRLLAEQAELAQEKRDREG